MSGIKNTINKNKSTNSSTSVSDKVSSAINKYKSTLSSSYEMETEENIITKTFNKIVNKYKETEAKKKQFRDENPGGTVSQRTFKNNVDNKTVNKMSQP